MSNPKSFPQQPGIQIAAVFGQGGVSDKQQDPLKLGNIQVWSPTEHSWLGVNPEHLALSPMIRKNQAEFPRPPDPGSLVYCLKTTGRTDALVLGNASESVSPSQGTPGNINLFMANPFLQEAFARVLNMWPLPDFQEKQSRGATIREVKEKQKQYSHSLLQGLPSQASLYQMAGISQPAVKNIETAKEHFQNILGNSILSQLPGTQMSLGKMMSNLSEKDIREIKEEMDDPNLEAALESLIFLLPNVEFSGGGQYITDSKVNEDVYMSNAKDLLKQAKSVSDISTVLSRLQVEKELFGLEELQDIQFEVQGPWGNTNYNLTVSGDWILQNSNISNTTATSKTSFQGFMESGSPFGGSASAASGQNMFGDSAGTIMDQIQRVFPEAQQALKKTVEAVNRDANAGKRNDTFRSVAEGGKYLERILSNVG